MDHTARRPGRAALPRSNKASCISHGIPFDHADDPHQDEIGDGNARLLIVSRQNERVERIVRCARVADSNLPIQRCERWFSRSK